MSPDLLETAIQAARAAGDVLRQKLKEPRQISSKGHLDIVTDADLAADQAIQSVIKAHHPDHEILSEESEEGKNIATWQPAEKVWWCIDPIDGTTNFARGTPLWSISIAVAEGKTLQAGVVYDVMRDDLFAARRGGGATLNGEPIHVKTDTELQWALISADYPVNPEKRHQMIRFITVLLPQVRSLRSWGTSALALAHIGAGYLDSYMQMNFKPWDVSAGIIILEEAGGLVTDLEGKPWQFGNNGILACGSHELHAQLLTRIS